MTGSTPSVSALRPAPQASTIRPPRMATNAPPSDAAMRRAAQQFETQALGVLLQPIFETADNSRGTFGGGAAESQWRPMLVDAYAAAAVRAGGFGIANAVYRELRRQADRTVSPNPENPGSATP